MGKSEILEQATEEKDYPDKWARTVAEKVTANEFIVERLPEGAIRLE